MNEISSMNDEIKIKENVIAILENRETGEKKVYTTHNVVTTAGSRYYPQKACGNSPTNNFVGTNAGLRLGSSAITPTAGDTDVTTFLNGTGLAVSANYPTTNDSNASNTGSGVNVATWMYYYAAGIGTATGITEGAIVDNIATPAAALSHFLFPASFNKGASDTLTVFVNHSFAHT